MRLEIRILDRIGGALVVLAVLLGTASSLQVAVRTHARFRREAEDARNSMEARSAARATLRKLESALGATREEFNKLRDKIPEVGHIGEFLERLDVLMRDHALVLTTLEPQPAIEENVFMRTPVRFACSGTSSNLFRLLYDLETMERVVTLESVTLSRKSLGEPCEADIRVSLYERAGAPADGRREAGP